MSWINSLIAMWTKQTERFMDFIGPRHERNSLEYCNEVEWVRSYKISKETSHKDTDSLLLEHARQLHGDVAARSVRLDAKLLDILKLSAALAVLLVTAMKAFGLPTTWYIAVSFLCLLAALVLALFSRQAFLRPALPSIHDVAEGLPRDETAKVWLATTIHMTCEAMRWHGDWVARRIFYCCLLIFLAVLSLTPVVLFNQPRPAGVNSSGEGYHHLLDSDRAPAESKVPAVVTESGEVAAVVTESDEVAAVKPAYVGQSLRHPFGDKKIQNQTSAEGETRTPTSIRTLGSEPSWYHFWNVSRHIHLNL